jgi:hypothetical protein
MTLPFKSAIKGAIVLALGISFGATSQNEPEKFTQRNAIYFEFGGNSGLYAFNFSRIIH